MPEDPARPQPEVETGAPQAPAMPVVYANVAGIRGGAFDASLEFGYQVAPSENEAPPPPMWHIRVAMSWEHLMALQELIQNTLSQYEQAVGSLPDLDKLKIKGTS